jgi:hypothetical protein
MEPVYLSLRWQNFLTIAIMVMGLALVYTLFGQGLRKFSSAGS